MIEVAPRSTEKMTFENAQLYILFYEYNGHRGWRLPTLAEWLSNKPPVVGWDSSGGSTADLLRYVTPVRDI